MDVATAEKDKSVLEEAEEIDGAKFHAHQNKPRLHSMSGTCDLI